MTQAIARLEMGFNPNTTYILAHLAFFTLMSHYQVYDAINVFIELVVPPSMTYMLCFALIFGWCHDLNVESKLGKATSILLYHLILCHALLISGYMAFLVNATCFGLTITDSSTE